MTEVEFTLEVQQRSLDVSLNNVSSTRSIFIHLSLLEHRFDVLKSEAHLDTISSITVLPRFYDPSIILFLLALVLTIAKDFFSPFVVVLQKLEILFVFHTIFDMEGQRQKIKDFLIGLFIIIGHSIEQGFLIANHIIINKMVVHSNVLYLL